MPKYKKCLCIKYCGKWYEVVHYNAKRREVQFVEKYYKCGAYLRLNTISINDNKFKVKRIEVSK